ncbi:MAG: hypothetical protein V8S95_10395, partial [Odoribacter sp.]
MNNIINHQIGSQIVWCFFFLFLQGMKSLMSFIVGKNDVFAGQMPHPVGFAGAITRSVFVLTFCIFPV